MNKPYEDAEQYGFDSPEAVLRCAVAVACFDGQFANDERERVRDIYADICKEMTFAYNRPDVSDDYEEIANSTAEIVLSMSDDNAKNSLIEECGKLITDRDLRELTLIMALRVAGADSELAQAEFRALKILADLWGILLHDVVSPYLEL